ncbi:MAG: DUF2141 domain-containing protein [Desulfobacterales bacterium]|nr:MAG: DUF2141 domain-containing protein [Desulfobacterales bacterium]
MLKKMSALFLSFWLIGVIAHAEEKFSLSGEVSFQYNADVHICLFTKEDIQYLPQHELSPPKCQAVRINADLKEAGKVSLKFDGITKGTYCIATFQDVTKNGKVDYENYQINEPFGTYKEQGPECGNQLDWNTIKFDLKKDITGIKITM